MTISKLPFTSLQELNLSQPETLKDLQAWKHYKDCLKSSMPPDYVPKYKYTDKTANGLTRAIIDYINFSGGFAERISTMGRVIDTSKIVTNVIGITKSYGGKKFIPGTGTKGSADISATIYGRSVKIEVKIGRDKQSDHQKEYEARTLASGGIYIIARNFEDFIRDLPFNLK
jgi:hypothetical protein